MERDKTTFNHEQQVNEGFSGEHIAQGHNASGEPLKPETEHDRHGNRKEVMRHRELNEDPEKSSDAPSDAHHDAKIAKEHQDFNRDVAPDRYPPSHRENHIDRAEP